MTYASAAKSWARRVAVVGGDAADHSLSAAGRVPASSSLFFAGSGSVATSGKGMVEFPASSRGWGIPEAAALAAIGGLWDASGRGKGSFGPPPLISKACFHLPRLTHDPMDIHNVSCIAYHV